MKTLGIIGGLGPLATGKLYQDVTCRTVAATAGRYPRIVIDSMPLHTRIERAFISDEPARDAVSEMRELLRESVERLCRAGVDAIALPCNTLQRIGGELVTASGVRFLDMTDLSFRRLCAGDGSRVLLLGSFGMHALGVYERFAHQNVRFVFPRADQQSALAHHILQLVREPLSAEARHGIETIVAEHAVAIDRVLLACTDLSQLGSTLADRPTVDSLSVLADACVELLIESDHA